MFFWSIIHVTSPKLVKVMTGRCDHSRYVWICGWGQTICGKCFLRVFPLFPPFPPFPWFPPFLLAQVTTMTEQAFNQLKGVTLRKPTKTICGADRKPLKVLGQINVTLSAKGQSCNQAVYIVRNLSQNLLGLPALSKASTS